MELVFENGWNGNRWMLDRLANFRQAADAATNPNTPARADVVEDKDAYHFYIEMPGLKGDSIDVQVEDDSLVVAAERRRPEWPGRPRFTLRSEQITPSNVRSRSRSTRGVMAYARPTLTGYSN